MPCHATQLGMGSSPAARNNKIVVDPEPCGGQEARLAGWVVVGREEEVVVVLVVMVVAGCWMHHRALGHRRVALAAESDQ
jgi:hypothetical protein